MRNLWESALIALDAIWSAKLRSFMTVLGNIVAVTSIIAVVSLIQGLNASVKQAILNQAGADSFNIQQFPITRSDEEFDKVRGNPRITLDDLRAGPSEFDEDDFDWKPGGVGRCGANLSLKGQSVVGVRKPAEDGLNKGICA